MVDRIIIWGNKLTDRQKAVRDNVRAHYGQPTHGYEDVELEPGVVDKVYGRNRMGGFTTGDDFLGRVMDSLGDGWTLAERRELEKQIIYKIGEEFGS